jgi:chromate reductase, NAD(P)H dehydrogenase (quinone)
VNTAALATVAALAPASAATVSYDGLTALPAFNPDHDGDALPEQPARLRHQIATADAVWLCTPEYAGTLPGSLKNLLDWTVGGGQLYGKPVAWLDVASDGRGKGARETLLTVLGYVGADIIGPACRRFPVDRASVGPDGTITDPGFRAEVTAAWAALIGYLTRQRQEDQGHGETG